jgi:hypothetical protein
MDDRTPIPAGDYNVHATKSEFKATKKKDGHQLLFTLKVLDGAHKGHTLFVGLNLNNPNPETVAIANKELNSMSQACGKVGVQDSDELHLIPFIAGVVVKPATAQYPEGNDVKSYKAIAGGMAPPNAVIPPVAVPPVTPPITTPPQPVAPVVDPVAVVPTTTPVTPVAVPPLPPVVDPVLAAASAAVVPVAPVAPVAPVVPEAAIPAPVAPAATPAPVAPVAPVAAAPGVAKLPWEV